MYMVVETKNPSGRTVLFDEDKHVYTVKETGKELTSCTRFIKEFTPEFETNKISKKYAEKVGMTQKEVIDMWEDNKNEASALGTEVHALAEAYLLKRKLPKLSERAKVRAKTLFPVLDYLMEDYKLIACEKIIFSERLNLAGTIDLLMEDKDSVCIFDWKTNKEIKVDSKWGKKMLPPVEHLEDCSLMHYTLQLNIYKTIMIEEGYFPKNTKFNMCIFHITDDEIIPYKIDDCYDEVQRMIRRL